MNTTAAIVLGEEAHIVAREPDGPRGESPLTAAERDDYSNLILLCPTDHTLIDKAPEDHSVEALLKIKADHEAWVRDSLGPKVDQAEIRWAQIVDQLSDKLSLDTWALDVHAFFDGGPITLAVTTEERLRECALWIAKRPWPAGQDKLKAAIRNMGIFLNELLSEFNVYAELRNGGERRRYPAFYKIPVWDTELYNSLLAEYRNNRTYLSDLTLEITRYINLFGDLVREDLDPSFRHDEGLTEVLAEGQPLEYGAYVPQFAREDLEVALETQALVAFKDSRASRSPRFKW
ncbi:hypothetical protein LN996_07165 [Arthrobacter sp. AK01]|uniref:hypothetical protein n=1 Tax=Arthrobacter sp. AK01 TaxID=2894084 RepID=UPI001E3A3695|nr:hypothetical protein [Arthrobacter sp. AK01]MCD4850585.1 hypothetical protein [Arthrobacter sp. AK01]